MTADQAFTRSSARTVFEPPSSEDLESAYAIAQHLRTQARYLQGGFWRAQLSRLAIAACTPLIGYCVFKWSGLVVAIALVADAWAVLLGDLLVMGLVDRAVRLACHRIHLRNLVLRVVRRLTVPLRGRPLDHHPGMLSIYTVSPSLFNIIGAIMLLFVTLPIAMFGSMIFSRERGDFDVQTLVVLCLLTVVLRLANASRVAVAARRERADYYELLPQGYAPSLALAAAACVWAFAAIIVDKLKYGAWVDQYLSLAFLLVYLLTMLAIGVAQLRTSTAEERELDAFLAVPVSTHQQQLHAYRPRNPRQ